VLGSAVRQQVVVVPGNATSSRAARRNGLALSLAVAFGSGAAVIFVTAVALPFLEALGRWGAERVGDPSGVAAAGWPTVLLAAVLGRVATKALKRETSGGSEPEDPISARSKTRIPWAKNLAELIAGPVVVIVVFGYVVALAAAARADGFDGVAFRLGSWGLRSWQLWAVATAVVLFVGWLVDAVNWSLHRFYKRRLWSAFTYDPATRDELDWSVPTRLTEHGVRVEGRPQLVMCGAAQVSGPDLAPPGHRAVTWTFDSDWIGGPEIGWCTTESMQTQLGDHGRGGDISMFGAVAISGAAFGSAMGRLSKGSLNAVFALANARLGVWLPNPRLLGERDADGNSKWRYKRHDLRYLVREIFGRYSPYDRWILVSDGGHYENLGLVELIRRRCTQIICTDATGDASGVVTTVAEALRLAEQELGVRVTLAAPWRVAPGTAEAGAPLPPKLADAIADRYALDSVVVGDITYPPEAGLPAGTVGRIVVARAVLEPTTPWPVLSYSRRHDVFPNDSTADQWFDADQFDDYRLLGHHVGGRVLEELAAIGWYDS
jgi:hypothetical protein